MNSQRSPESERHDELVAYLDGELSPEESRRIEQQLSSDEEYRHELRGLDDVWQALDELPQTAVDESFSRTTIEMVTVAAREDLATKTAALPIQRRNRRLLVGSLTALAVIVGFVVARILWPSPNQALLAELPIIQHVDVYAEIDDVEFLRRLRESDDVLPLEKDSRKVESELAAWREVTRQTPRERRERIEQMSRDQRSALLTKSNRFFQLSPADQERIRELHATVLAADDSEELQKTMLAFGDWIQGRTPGERADLRARDLDQRIERIRDLARRDRWRSFSELTTQDAAAIRNEALALFEDERHDVEKMFKREGVKDIDRKIAENRGILVQFVALRALESNHDRDQVLERFMRSLSEPVRDRLEDMRNDRAAWVMRRWVRQVFREEVTPIDLEYYFAHDLDNTQREQLLAMPADQMEETLYAWYVREKFGLRDPPNDEGRDSLRRPDRDGRREERRNPRPGPPPPRPQESGER